MSLCSGKNYTEDITTQQDAASGEQQTEVADQATKKKETRRQVTQSPGHLDYPPCTPSDHHQHAYAKAKAARVEVAFAEREADVMKQKAELKASTLKEKASLDANLHLLKSQRAAAAAEAEATAYEEVEEETGEHGQLPDVDEEPLSTVQRTSEYIQQHSDLFFDERRVIKPAAFHVIQSNVRLVNKDVKKESTIIVSPSETYPLSTQCAIKPEREYLSEPKGAEDFTRYLIRREMVSAGLLQFDDKPENYWSWKASFLSFTKDLNLSAREELDLLTKWLGAESSEQAKRTRAVHVLNPAAGVTMVWQRLEECYGTPEVTEDALLKKTENFPRLTNRDTIKLRELSDILLELECAKRDGALPELSYLDTARGVKQILRNSLITSKKNGSALEASFSNCVEII